MIWILGLVIYFFLVMLLTAPFILSSRVSRAEEKSGTYEKSSLCITGDKTVYREKYNTPTKKGNRGMVLERPLPYGKHLPLGGRSSG
jgi:hypothetical protein